MDVADFASFESTEGEWLKGLCNGLREHFTVEIQEGLKMLYLNQKNVLTTEEVMIYTGFSSSKLYKLTSSGEIPCYRPTSGKLYFDKKELDNWLLSNKQNANPEVRAEANRIIRDRGI